MTPEALEALLDSIYAAGVDHRLWEGVLATLTHTISGMGGSLHAGRTDGASFSFACPYRIDPAALAAYADYYYSVNPLNAALSRIPVGRAVPDHKLVARAEVQRTEVYDFSRRFDIFGSVTIVVARDGQFESCLGIVCGRRSDVFSDEQVSFLQRLSPHIQRSIGLNRRLAGMQNECATLETALGSTDTAVFVLNKAGVIHYCNAAGENLLKERDGLKVVQGRLCTDNSSTQNSLTGLIRGALVERGARGGSISVPRQHPARPLHVKVMPVGQRNGFLAS